MAYKPLQVKDFLSIGRNVSNDWRIDVPTVSGSHAHLQKVSNTQWLFKDLGSANGCEVNGQRISEVLITANDRLTLCKGSVTLDTSSLFASVPKQPTKPTTPTPIGNNLPKSAPNEFTYSLTKLKEIHDEFHEKQKALKRGHSIKTRVLPALITSGFMLVTYFWVQDPNTKLAFLGLNVGVGAAIGVLIGNMFDIDEPLRKLNEEYSLKYKCKVNSCDRSLGLHNSPKILEGQKTCPCGKNNCK